MLIVPVLDLKGGVVVRAHLGQRDRYRPIETPLSPTSAPVDVARGLLAVHPFETIYVADLDAITGRGDNDAALVQLRAAFPQVTLWVDNGIADVERAAAWLSAGLGHLVIGSETQRGPLLVQHLAGDARVALSLDFRGEAFQGPATLLEPSRWPQRVIVMTLARVGSDAGPDLARLAGISAMADGRSVYAAGGVRDPRDLAVLKQRGIAGALVATALHDGRLTAANLAAL